MLMRLCAAHVRATTLLLRPDARQPPAIIAVILRRDAAIDAMLRHGVVVHYVLPAMLMKARRTPAFARVRRKRAKRDTATEARARRVYCYKPADAMP